MPQIFLFLHAALLLLLLLLFFFFNDTATTEIYTLSLHDALPICSGPRGSTSPRPPCPGTSASRSEEHTSELQSRFDLVCRLLLEKKKTTLSRSSTGTKKEESSQQSMRGKAR